MAVMYWNMKKHILIKDLGFSIFELLNFWNEKNPQAQDASYACLI